MKLENLNKIDVFLQTYDLPKVSQFEANNLNKATTGHGIVKIINTFSTTNWTTWVTVEFYQSFSQVMPVLLDFFCKMERERNLLNSVCEDSIMLIPKSLKKTTKRILQFSNNLSTGCIALFSMYLRLCKESQNAFLYEVQKGTNKILEGFEASKTRSWFKF